MTMQSSDVMKPCVVRSSMGTNSVYPNPRVLRSHSGRLNASSSGRDIIVSQMFLLGSLAFTNVKLMRPMKGQAKQESWSVRIRWMSRAMWLLSLVERFIRAQNLLNTTTQYYKAYLNSIKENKYRLNSGNACYYALQGLLSSQLLSKNIKLKIYKSVILPVKAGSQ